MKWAERCGIVLAMLFVGPHCLGQTPSNAAVEASATPVFSISVAPPAGPIRLGSPINVVVTMTNISGGHIDLASDRGPQSKYKAFTFLLTKNGKEVKTTFFYRKITGRKRPDDPSEVEHGGSIVLSYPAGPIIRVTADLNKLYQVTEPGVYTLVVSRFDVYSKTMVRSEPVILKIKLQNQ
jgi:hypothetical protein